MLNLWRKSINREHNVQPFKSAYKINYIKKLDSEQYIANHLCTIKANVIEQNEAHEEFVMGDPNLPVVHVNMYMGISCIYRLRFVYDFENEAYIYLAVLFSIMCGYALLSVVNLMTLAILIFCYFNRMGQRFLHMKQ